MIQRARTRIVRRTMPHSEIEVIANTYGNRDLRELTTSCKEKLKRYYGQHIHSVKNHILACRFLLGMLEDGTVKDQSVSELKTSCPQVYDTYLKMIHNARYQTGHTF